MRIEYQIKEMAEILNLSQQMIRYYEQCGVIKPRRNENNNYRIYTTMDYFALVEAIGLSKFDVNIKDIASLKANDYANRVSQCYRQFIADSERNIQYQIFLKERAEDLLVRNESARMNRGNYWVKKIRPHILYPLMDSRNDDYGKITTPVDVLKTLNSTMVSGFLDGIIEFCPGTDHWWFSIDQKYAEILLLPECSERIDVPEQYCICTIFDMGDIGDFRSDTVQSALEHALSMDYEIDGIIQGLMIARGFNEESYNRFLELRIPVKKV